MTARGVEQEAGAVAPARPAARSRRPLAALCCAEIVSTTGAEITAVALPWFVLTTTGSPARMAVVLAAEFAGMALLGVPSGAVAAAAGPRRTMLASDLSRALLVAAVPALHLLDLLSLPLLAVIAFAVGGFFPAYTSSQRLVLAGLVGGDEVRLTRVGGLLGSANETASFVGPALGGTLIAALGATSVLLVDAGSYLVAFALVALLVPAAAAAPAAPAMPAMPAGPGDGDRDGARAGGGVLAGVRHLVRDRQLAQPVLGVSVVEIGFTALLTCLPVLALRRFEGGAGLAGWLLASYGAGSVAGGLLAARARRAGPRLAAWAVLGMAASTWPLVAPLPPAGVAVAIAADGVCSGLFFPRFFASLTLRPPAPLRAQVLTAATTALAAAGPLGFVAAGLLLQHSASPTPALVLVAGATTVGALVVASTPRGGASARPR